MTQIVDSIIAIPAFNDNYIWAIMHPTKDKCYIVDPGDSVVVLDFLDKQNKVCAGILLTHHHNDHQGGVTQLVEKYQCNVWGPEDERMIVSNAVTDGAQIVLDDSNITLNVVATPGHTSSHIAFYNNDWLFCGDTLFSAGCGRVFEGSMQEMYCSLQTLAKLPGTTKIYCAHEYTLNNIKFALLVEPNNEDLQQYQQDCIMKRQNGIPTIPSTMCMERKINPFLRCEEESVISAACSHSMRQLNDPVAVFTEIRRWKDRA
jgi:hydroxyacylglutathione hydrolase